MALQTSGPISIKQIAQEMGNAIGNNSLALISFYASRPGPPYSISSFYGYSALQTVEKIITSLGPSPEIMCEYGKFFATQQVYSSTDPIQVGAVLYSDSSGGSAFTQGPGWTYEPSTNKSFNIDETGNVTEEFQC